MSSFDVPRPKKRDYTRRVAKLVGRGSFNYLDEGAYNRAVADWEEARRKHGGSQRSNNRRRPGRTRELIIETGVTALAIGTGLAGSGTPPNTDQLSDSQGISDTRKRDKTGDASNRRGRHK